MKKIFFICDWDYSHLMSKIALKLEVKWFNCTSCLVIWKTYLNRLNNNKIKNNFISKYLLQDVLERNDFEKFFDLKKIEKLEEKYWIPTLWIFLWADRHDVFDDYKKNIWKIILLFEYYEKIYSEERPDYIVTNAYAAMPHLISYFVWIRMWIKFLSPVNLRISTKTFFSNSPYETINLTKKSDNILKNQIRVIIKKFKKDAKQWDFSSVTTSEDKKSFYANDEDLNKISTQIRLWLRYSYRYYISKEYSWDHTKPSPFYMIYEYIKSEIEKYYVIKRLKFDKLSKWQKYVYFPLHHQPESSTMTLSPFYLNQIFTLEILSKSIPANIIIVTKEHPWIIWHRGIDYYKEIRKFSNVIFIHPNTDSLELTRNAEFIFTLTWTVWLEALLIGKPAIMAWKWFFHDHKLICNLEDIAITKWAKTIKQYIENYNYDENSVIEFLSDLYESSYDFKMTEPWDNPNSPILDEDNINKIVNALIKNLNS